MAVVKTASVSERLTGLDGLRAISILLVLAGHGAWTAGAPHWVLPLRDCGLAGVEIFFVISGFIITHLLLRERRRHGEIDLPAFWTRRALRIVPPLLVASAAIAVAAQSGLLQWWWSSFFGALTLTKDTPLLGGDWFFGHTWSLALEEQFYLLWPLLLVWVLDARRLIQGLCVLLLASPLLAVSPAWLPSLQNLLPYLPYLGAGCLLALLTAHAPDWLAAQARRRGVMALAIAVIMLAAALGWLRHAKWEPLPAATAAPLAAAAGLLGPAAALALVARAVLAERTPLLSSAPLVWLGRRSYSLYLWQQLFLGPPHVYTHAWRWSVWPWNLLAALVCGVASYVFVEQPCARLKSRLLRARAHRAARKRMTAVPAVPDVRLVSGQADAGGGS
jgi:peptidoglycan/LPS O-acetylase OafA/YrhL